MGRGRHTSPLAAEGYRTFGVDVRFDAVRKGVERARARGLVVRAWCADLSAVRLPRERFDVVVVARYLQRDLFPSIRETVKRGGFVLYETFTIAQRKLGFGPTSAEHLLEPGELAGHFRDFEIVFYEETESPEAVARLVAKKSATF
jgi:tellurite methyltransferase